VPERAPAETRSDAVLTANRTAVVNYSANTAFDQALADKLETIQARTLIVMGYKEQIIPVETGHLLKTKIPHSHLTYVFGAAHAIEFDQPERVGTLVADFLERGESFIVRETAA
jgi:pimeloyl-ACP methyl ester carboxylesterase